MILSVPFTNKFINNGKFSFIKKIFTKKKLAQVHSVSVDSNLINPFIFNSSV